MESHNVLIHPFGFQRAQLTSIGLELIGRDNGTSEILALHRNKIL